MPTSAPAPRATKRPEPKILFQSYFKSVGPRTYAAQVKQAGNGNHFLVLTEGKREDATAEPRKTRIYIYSEDFAAFFRLAKEAADFIKANPVPSEVVQRRKRFWTRQQKGRLSHVRSPSARAGAVPAAAPR
jgi:hypothetical protein